jgi:ethanolamine utilization microcompartment shell protein EutL
MSKKPIQIDAFLADSSADERAAIAADKAIKEANTEVLIAKVDKLQEDMDRLIKRLM